MNLTRVSTVSQVLEPKTGDFLGRVWPPVAIAGALGATVVWIGYLAYQGLALVGLAF